MRFVHSFQRIFSVVGLLLSFDLVDHNSTQTDKETSNDNSSNNEGDRSRGGTSYASWLETQHVFEKVECARISSVHGANGRTACCLRIARHTVVVEDGARIVPLILWRRSTAGDRRGVVKEGCVHASQMIIGVRGVRLIGW